MAASEVVAAVEERLRGGFHAAPISSPNENSPTPSDGSPFIELQFPLEDSRQMGLSKVYQNEGAFRVVISHRRGLVEDLRTAQSWANQIAQLFRSEKFAGVQCWAPTIGRMDDDNEDGGYYVLSVVVPYWFSFTG